MNTVTATAIATTNTVGSESDFIRKEIAVWGEEYVDDLIDRNFLPVLLTENGALKWVWVQRS